MKWIKYEYVCGTNADGSEILAKKRVGYSDANLVIAQAEAYNGEYTIENDGTEVSNETKVPGDMDMQGNRITNLGDPISESDAISKKALTNYAFAKNQGSANVGKILAIGTDGNIILTNMPEGGDIVGVVDESNNILLQGVLANGTYTLKYENEDGTYSDVGTIIIGSIPVPDDPEPTLTNLIPLSTDASGNPYVGTNGEDGYKEGYKVSVTGGGESAAAGYKITGFMPVTYDDTLYFKGISFESTGTNTNFCCYDSSKARIGGNNWFKVFSSGVNGQVVSVAVKDLVFNTGVGDVQDDLQNVAYIRLSASVMDENSIITVNEPIE